MNFVIKFDGGPLDGTYEFPNFSRGQFPPQTDLNRFSAHAHLSITNGEVGKAAGGLSPAALGTMMGQGHDTLKGSGATRHSYVNMDRREEGDTVYVTAQYMKEVAPPPQKPMLPSEFTIEQLVQELVNRPQFAGVVIYAVRGEQGQQPQAGDKFHIASHLSRADIAKLLSSIPPQFKNP